jgi:hypothetical protein
MSFGVKGLKEGSVIKHIYINTSAFYNNYDYLMSNMPCSTIVVIEDIRLVIQAATETRC